MVKFLSKIRKNQSQMTSNDNTVLSIFVSAYTPISSSIFVNVFELFPSDSLGGDFLYKTNFEVC